jgi:hypothetical protein
MNSRTMPHSIGVSLSYLVGETLGEEGPLWKFIGYGNSQNNQDFDSLSILMSNPLSSLNFVALVTSTSETLLLPILHHLLWKMLHLPH